MTEPERQPDIWGDDPEEVDASAVVAELGSRRAGRRASLARSPRVRPVQGRRTFHPPQRQAHRDHRRRQRRPAPRDRGLALPILPGWALIFVGLRILATEYMWARRLLMKAKDVAQTAADKTIRRKSARTKREADPSTSVDAD